MRPCAIDTPLDILGAFKMRLQHQGDAGQFQGLVIREGGLGPLGIGLHAHPFLREAHGLLSLVPDLPLEDGQGLAPGDDPQIRGDGPVHHGFGQPVDRVEKDGVAADVGGVPGIHHPAADGIHHGHAPHAHGHVFVPEPLVEAVTHRGQGIFAGQHLLVHGVEVFGADVEFRMVLPGKRGVGGVLADGAGAQGHLDGAAGALGQISIGLGDGLGQLRRQVRAHDERLDFRTLAVEVRNLHFFHGLEAPVDLIRQLVVGQEPLIGRGGDGKPRGHRDLRQLPGDLPQVGHLAAHPVGHLPAHFREGQHQGRNRRRLPLGQDGVDLSFNGGKDRLQRPVAVAGQFIQILDDIEDVDTGGGGVGPDKGHAEAVTAAEGRLHVGHELQGGVVGGEQELEGVIASLEGGPQFFHGQSRFRLFPGKQAL